MTRIRVEAGAPYDVLIERGLLGRVPELINDICPTRRAAIITDDTVNGLYGAALEDLLREHNYSVCKFVFPHGEGSKNLSTYTEILNFLGNESLTRSDTVIALGGGVVGDLSGFAAATYLRGIRFIQIPTTLLASVDSSVGGKTGVDLPAGKNLAGAFHQPSMVVCDPDTLKTLDGRTFADGMSEALKCGILSDPELFFMIADGSGEVEDMIGRCVRIKADIVGEDEFDRGRRALLNLGHTVGHAVEKLSGFSMTHGQAVGFGLAAIARASASAGMCSESCAVRISEAVKKLGHPLSVPYKSEEIFGAIRHDKKRAGDRTSVITVREIGRCESVSMDDGELLEFIRRGLEVFN